MNFRVLFDPEDESQARAFYRAKGLSSFVAAAKVDRWRRRQFLLAQADPIVELDEDVTLCERSTQTEIDCLLFPSSGVLREMEPYDRYVMWLYTNKTNEEAASILRMSLATFKRVVSALQL